MGLLNNLMWAGLHLLVIAIDISIFFLLVRIILVAKYVCWLQPFDEVGRPLVEAILSDTTYL